MAITDLKPGLSTRQCQGQSEELVIRSSGRAVLEKGNWSFSTKQNPPNALLMCVYLSVVGIPIPCEETKGPGCR